MTMFFSGLLFGAGVTLLVNYLIDKSKADKARMELLEAELQTLRNFVLGEDTEEDE